MKANKARRATCRAGPYELDFEALVRKDVRAMVHNSEKFQLEFAVAIGQLPLSVRWRVVEWTPGFTQQKQIRRGGEW